MDIKQRLKLYYPKNVLEPSTPYVYFETLLKTDVGEYIYDTVKPYFHLSLGETSPTKAQLKIKSALDFLSKIITAESQKEQAFILFLNKKIRANKLQLTVPSSTEDWSKFIQDIQAVMNTDMDTGLRNLANEFSRLKINQEIREKSKANSYYTHALDDQITSMTEYLKQVEAVIDPNHNTTDIGLQIYNIILHKFKDQLLEINGDSVVFNHSQLAALVQAIATLTLRDYSIKNWDGKTNLKLDKFIEVIEEDTFSNQISSFIERAKKYPWITDDLLKNFNMNTEEITNNQISKKEREKILKSIQPLNAAGEQLQDLSKIFHENFQSKPLVTEKSFSLVSTGSNLAEVVSSTVIGAFNGSFYSLGTGSRGTKPDNIIALLTMDLDSLNPKSNKNYDLIVQKIKDLRNIMNDLTDTLKSTNTTEYYKTQQENWKKAEEEMTKILNELTKLYGQVVDCYTIEDSTKNYLFLNARARGNLNESFHGGSLGAHLEDQLNKINALAQTGGFSMVDIKWLTSVIINSGPRMIASEAKNSIEQYLATFATILLFDDQVNIADDAIHQMTENSGSSVNKIHLFSLNGGYYPLSYVLYLTHTALSKGYDDILQEVQSGSGAKVNITGYVSSYGQYKSSWNKTAEGALDSTKLELQFMVRFMGILNSLFPNFS